MAHRISRATRSGRRLGHAGEPTPRLTEEAQRARRRADEPREHGIERSAPLALVPPPRGAGTRSARAAYEAARSRVQRRAGKGKHAAALEAAVQARAVAEEIERARGEAEGHAIGRHRALHTAPH